ncbi:hypothetical protein R9X47_15325 [Wukongibacter baidiensis]|uniref:hypothetical protein n=1 Tax=Wukongibacter baidiensis TaxID=1723361 RepID=UPI003D7F8EE2
MENKQIKYRDLLIQKLTFLEKLYENIIMQEKAIKHKNSKKLINLIDESGNFIDRINKINNQINHMDMEVYYDEKSLKISQLIKSKTEEIYLSYFHNYTRTKEMVEELRSCIKRVNLGKKAILGGYLKRQQQVYGYFVDKKVGKSCGY